MACPKSTRAAKSHWKVSFQTHPSLSLAYRHRDILLHQNHIPSRELGSKFCCRHISVQRLRNGGIKRGVVVWCKWLVSGAVRARISYYSILCKLLNNVCAWAETEGVWWGGTSSERFTKYFNFECDTTWRVPIPTLIYNFYTGEYIWSPLSVAVILIFISVTSSSKF